jgi:hypothetical protein
MYVLKLLPTDCNLSNDIFSIKINITRFRFWQLRDFKTCNPCWTLKATHQSSHFSAADPSKNSKILLKKLLIKSTPLNVYPSNMCFCLFTFRPPHAAPLAVTAPNLHIGVHPRQVGAPPVNGERHHSKAATNQHRPAAQRRRRRGGPVAAAERGACAAKHSISGGLRCSRHESHAADRDLYTSTHEPKGTRLAKKM